MRLFLFLSCLLLGQLSHAAPGSESPNIAYDDRYVWSLAQRLTDNLTQFQAKAGLPTKDPEWQYQKMQFEFLYHHYLVKCDGPLPKIAAILQSESVGDTSELPDVSAEESRIRPVIQEWHARIFLQLMHSYASGDYGVFPECVVPGFKAQNPIPVDQNPVSP